MLKYNFIHLKAFIKPLPGVNMNAARGPSTSSGAANQGVAGRSGSSAAARGPSTSSDAANQEVAGRSGSSVAAAIHQILNRNQQHDVNVIFDSRFYSSWICRVEM